MCCSKIRTPSPRRSNRSRKRSAGPSAFFPSRTSRTTMVLHDPDAASDLSAVAFRRQTVAVRTERTLFIDNIRSTMIILVVSMHAAVTYSIAGRWYYMEKPALSVGAEFVLVTWQAYLQAFFMGFLFFIAGYFVPPAFDRKGGLRFLKERAFRLGMPVLFYIFILGPFTEYYVAGSWRP